jgi:hypothetical protein
MVNHSQGQLFPRPARGFPWMLIGGEEILTLGGFVLLSWVASSALLYTLEASLFLVAVSLLEIFLVAFVFMKPLPSKEYWLASFRLLPSWQGIVVMVALVRCAIALPIIIFLIILGSQLRIIPYPSYWWNVGDRFLLVSTDLSLLFPIALKAMASRGKRVLRVRWFLASWTILILGWLGGIWDFEQRIYPPKAIMISAWIAVLIVLLINALHFRKIQCDEVLLTI